MVIIKNFEKFVNESYDDAKDIGKIAKERGIPKEFNPYTEDSDEFKSWNKGWEAGKELQVTESVTEDELSNMTISEIAQKTLDVLKATKQKYPYAEPYLEAMLSMNSIKDNYHADRGDMIVAYFLSNASTLKGEEMRAIKKELNKRLKTNDYKSIWAPTPGSKPLPQIDENMKTLKFEEFVNESDMVIQKGKYFEKVPNPKYNKNYDYYHEIGDDIKELRKERAQIFKDQDMDPDIHAENGAGGKATDQYGKRLNDIEKEIVELTDKQAKLDLEEFHLKDTGKWVPAALLRKP